jgi:fructose-bisphosphate aldolase class I
MGTLPSNIVSELQSTIITLASSGKGLLAADESTGTILKRFEPLNIPCTEETRRDYRELLLTTPDIEKYISGVILFEETLSQKTSQGVSFPELLTKQGIVPGIKVDKGLIDLPRSLNEKTTQGLDGLTERLLEYKKLGARFAKWRTVYSISDNTPSTLANHCNAESLASYAAICQTVGIVPIVEPEVLMDGNHRLDSCFHASERALQAVFNALALHKVLLEYIILKPSMILPGKNYPQSCSAKEIAEATVTVLKRTVPAAVPSINFLSGGQTPEQATQNLNAMHKVQGLLPWNVSFSFARALQEPSMKAWLGKPENIATAQQMFFKRAKLNSLASLGKYENNME